MEKPQSSAHEHARGAPERLSPTARWHTRVIMTTPAGRCGAIQRRRCWQPCWLLPKSWIVVELIFSRVSLSDLKSRKLSGSAANPNITTAATTQPAALASSAPGGRGEDARAFSRTSLHDIGYRRLAGCSAARQHRYYDQAASRRVRRTRRSRSRGVRRSRRNGKPERDQRGFGF